MPTSHIDIGRLSVDERLGLVEELWASLAEKPHAIPMTSAQRAELDRRLDAVERDGPVGIAWDDMVAKLRATGR
jgi:putative addiction module component (TIGR02574 family)